MKKFLKLNSILSISFWLKNIVLYHAINYIFYLPSVETFETFFENAFYQQSREIVILIHGSREKVIWDGRRRKVNGAGAGAEDRGKVIPVLFMDV